MHDAKGPTVFVSGTVGVSEAFKDFVHDVHGRWDGEHLACSPEFAHEREEISAVDELEGEEVGAVHLTEVENLADV